MSASFPSSTSGPPGGNGKKGASTYSNRFAAFDEQTKAHQEASNKKIKTRLPPTQVKQLPESLHGKEKDADIWYPPFSRRDKAQKIPFHEVYLGDSMYTGGDPATKGFPARGWGEKRNAMGRMLGQTSRAQHEVRVVVKPDDDAFASAGHCGAKPDNGDNDIHLHINPRIMCPYVCLEIVLSRKAHPKKEGKTVPDKVAKLYATARHLKHGESSIGIKQDMPGLMDINDDEKSWPDVKNNAERGDLWRVTLDCAANNLELVGLSPQDLEALAAKTDDIESWDSLSDADQVLAWLLAARKTVIVYASLEKGREAKPFVRKFNDRCRALFYANAHDGGLWWYQQGFPKIGIRDPKFPWHQVEIPRWMVTEWLVTECDDGEYEDFEPYQWNRFSTLIGGDTLDTSSVAGELSIALSRERRKVQLHLAHLANSAKIVRGRLYPHPFEQDTLFVQVDVYQQNEGKRMVPELGRAVYLDFYHDNLRYNLNCVVIDNPMSSEVQAGSWTVSAKIIRPSDPAKFKSGHEVELGLEFPNDTTAIDRSAKALALLQKEQARKSGVHFPSAVFGSPLPEHQKTNWLHDTLKTKNMLKRYLSQIKKHGLNADQLIAAENVVQPGPDMSLIWGPPGTGKTHVTIAVMRALWLCGFTLIVGASSNNAVDVDLQAFVQGQPDSFDKLSVARFAGSISREHAHAAPKRKSDDDMDMTDAPSAVPAPAPKGLGTFAKPISKTGFEEPKGAWKEGTNWAEIMTDAENATEETDKAQREAEEKAAAELAAHRLNLTFEMVALNARSGKSNLKMHDYAFASQMHAFIEEIANKPDPEFELTEEEGRAEMAAWLAAPERELETSARRYLELHGELSAGAKVTGLKQKRAEFRELNESLGGTYLSQRCKVIFCTNSSSGHRLLADHFRPTIALQDEAAQASIGDAVVLLAVNRENVHHWIQCGDHKQLRPQSNSHGCNECSEALLTSLFEVQEQAIDAGRLSAPMQMLSTQYRMHSSIADFASKHYYDGKLKTAPGLDELTDIDKLVLPRLAGLQKQHHWNGKTRVFGIDISNDSVTIDGERKSIGDEGTPEVFSEKYGNTYSSVNETEAHAAVRLYTFLRTIGVPASSIKIIVPYKGQILTIRSSIFKYNGIADDQGKIIEDFNAVDILPMDGCQGTEADIVIVCHVMNERHNPANLGFIYEEGKVNVVRTRAKRFIFYFGNFLGQRRAIASASTFMNSKKVHAFRGLITDMIDKREVIAYDQFFLIVYRDAIAPQPTFYTWCYKALAATPRFQPHPEDNDEFTSSGKKVDTAGAIEKLGNMSMSASRGGQNRGKGRGGRGGGGRGGGGRGGGGRGGGGRGGGGRGGGGRGGGHGGASSSKA